MATASAPPHPPARRARVLLVEDNAINEAVGAAMLGVAGVDVAIARDGLQALDAYARGGIDLILMDCQMPVMDGFEATSAIREAEEGGEVRVPILALTGNAEEGDEQACLSAGMDGHLTKPLEPDALKAALERWLPRVEAAATPAPGEPAPRPEARGCPEQGALLSPAALDSLVALDPSGGDALIREILEQFLEETPRLLAEVRRAVAGREAATVSRIAHSAKSTSACVGASRLQTIWGELETLARRGSLVGADSLVERAADCFERSSIALEARLESDADARRPA